MGFKNYVKWERENAVYEKKLPGFRLTNRQMYWLSYANLYFKKYTGNALDALNIQYTYSHVWFKSRSEFREAFNCSALSHNEKVEFENFKKMLLKVYSQ